MIDFNSLWHSLHETAGPDSKVTIVEKEDTIEVYVKVGSQTLGYAYAPSVEGAIVKLIMYLNKKKEESRVETQL